MTKELYGLLEQLDIFSTSKKKLKTSSSVPNAFFPTNSSAARIGSLLELDFAPIWNFLSDADVCVLLEACCGVLSNEFVRIMSLKQIDKFCEKNLTHLGRRCGCDWIRNLSFTPSPMTRARTTRRTLWKRPYRYFKFLVALVPC